MLQEKKNMLKDLLYIFRRNSQEIVQVSKQKLRELEADWGTKAIQSAVLTGT